MNEDKVIQRFDRLETEIAEVKKDLTDFKDKSLTVKRFSESKLDQANNEYAELEKKYLNDKNFEIVLVSVDDMNNLEKLYPNYFLDTEEFVKLLSVIDQKINEN